MDDLISRQAAIDILDAYQVMIENGEENPYSWARLRMSELPSAQPEPHYDEWCDDCKEYDKERHCCPRWNRVIRQALKDAQPEQRWIPCRESNGNIHPYSELLHESKGILVTYKTRTGRRYVKQVLCNHGRVEKILLGDIVAWLPLPTPYREDEEE